MTPATVTDADGTTLRVHRAWPRKGGDLTFESTDAQGRIRAGIIQAQGKVRVAPYAEDPALPGLSAAATRGTLLVHRYKRRAVVKEEAGYTKLVASEKAAGIADAHRLMRRLARPSGILVPDVVVQHPEKVTLSVIPGLSFHELAQPGGDAGAVDSGTVPPEWSGAWRTWAERWPLFAVAELPPRNAAPQTAQVPDTAQVPHTGQVPRSGQAPHRTKAPGFGAEGIALGSVSLALHSTRDEARTVATWVNHVRAFNALPVTDDRLQWASAEVARLLIAGAPEKPVLSHRDLHDKQLLFAADTGAIGLIDCDTIALAEPALDLANLLVHIRFRNAQGIYGSATASAAEQEVLGVAEAMGVSERRLDAYAASTKLRLACLYAFRPAYRSLAHEWFESLEHDLTESSVA